MTNLDRIFARIMDGQAAIAGDEDAARRYLGGYVLVRLPNGKLYRGDDPLPPDAEVVPNAMDTGGYLLPEYWILPRVGGGRPFPN